MDAVGVVAEYNPFHFGHLEQLRAIRREDPETPVVAVLSGDYVQRGEAAVFSKFARAEAAVRCGVSLALELPVPWCLASAEGFARGAVGLLAAAGVVDRLSFGSESGDLEGLRRCAEALETEGYKAALRRELEGGASFAAARSRAAATILGEETAGLLRRPNDLLGVEYIRASMALPRPLTPLPVRRETSAHDGPGSAGELRRRMAAGEEWLSAVPEAASAAYREEMARGRGPVLAGDLRLPLISRLRERTPEDLAALPDAGEGLENKLFRAARTLTSPEEIAAAAKSRRYALSRLRRMVMAAALGLRREDARGTPPYIRVLAMDEKGKELLSAMRKRASLPVIVKSAHVRRLDEIAQAIFALGSDAHDLYVLGFSRPGEQRGGEDYRYTPFTGGVETINE